MDFIRKYKLWIVASSILIVFIGFYYYVMRDSSSTEIGNPQFVENPFNLSENTPTQETKGNVEVGELIVDIKGAIKQPGVYELQIGERVHHLIEEAGGLTRDADELAINLAAPLQDGMVLYIPKEGEVTNNPFMTPNSLEESKSNDKININKASSEELQMLTGIGVSKAEAIIQYREESGYFISPEDLLNVSGIGEKSLEKIKEEITTK